MDAPVCRICGKKHWSRVCDGDDDVTKRVTRNAIVTPPVTPAVTSRDVPRTVAPSKLAAAEAEIEALRAEVAMLKQELAFARGGKPKPLTPAQRVAKHRAKAKQAV